MCVCVLNKHVHVVKWVNGGNTPWKAKRPKRREERQESATPPKAATPPKVAIPAKALAMMADGIEPFVDIVGTLPECQRAGWRPENVQKSIPTEEKK